MVLMSKNEVSKFLHFYSIYILCVFLFINYRQEIKNMYNFVIFLNDLYHNVTFCKYKKEILRSIFNFGVFCILSLVR